MEDMEKSLETVTSCLSRIWGEASKEKPSKAYLFACCKEMAVILDDVESHGYALQASFTKRPKQE